MPKITFGLIVFNDDHILDEVLTTVEQYGTVVAAEGPAGVWTKVGFKESTDNTLSILAAHGVKTISGQWATKDDMCNGYMSLVDDDTDFLWMIDADEVYKPEDIEQILELLEHKQYDSVGFRLYSFWGGFDHTIGGFEENFETHRIQRYYPGARWTTHRPPTILSPEDGKPWREHRHLGYLSVDSLGIRIYHYSHVFPFQVRQKSLFYYLRAPHRTIPNHFENVYMPWVTGDKDTRIRIEAIYQGVHDWLPDLRGPTFTHLFEGTHPEIIQRNMSALIGKIVWELEELNAYATPGMRQAIP